MRASVTSLPFAHSSEIGKVEEHLNRVFKQIEKDGGGKVKGVSHYPMQGAGIMIFVVTFEEPNAK